MDENQNWRKLEMDKNKNKRKLKNLKNRRKLKIGRKLKIEQNGQKNLEKLN